MAVFQELPWRCSYESFAGSCRPRWSAPSLASASCSVVLSSCPVLLTQPQSCFALLWSSPPFCAGTSSILRSLGALSSSFCLRLRTGGWWFCSTIALGRRVVVLLWTWAVGTWWVWTCCGVSSIVFRSRFGLCPCVEKEIACSCDEA